MVKPLPLAILKPNQKSAVVTNQKTGIVLGDNVIWNPATLPNGHVVLIGASGSGENANSKGDRLRTSAIIPRSKNSYN